MGKHLLGLAEVLYQVCNLTQEAGLETVLSAAFSLKHAANMNQTFSTKDEAMDRAKWMELSPEAAQNCGKATPSGRLTLCFQDGLILPSEYKPPKESLVQLVQTEREKSEVSCAIDYDDPGFLKATPMVHTDVTRSSDFTLAHMAIQTDDSEDEDIPPIPEELRQTIGCHLWLANLEVSAAISPSMLLTPSFTMHPHPDGPTPTTMNQLLDSQVKLEEAHQNRDLTRMLKGVITNMHCLTKFARETGLTLYIGHAHYLFACYRTSQASSRSPPFRL